MTGCVLPGVSAVTKLLPSVAGLADLPGCPLLGSGSKTDHPGQHHFQPPGTGACSNQGGPLGHPTQPTWKLGCRMLHHNHFITLATPCSNFSGSRPSFSCRAPQASDADAD
jgi:hypothetical protein